MSAITGWFSALVAQHMFVDEVPKPQRRSWNFVGTQWVVTDDAANDRLDIELSLDFDTPIVLSPIAGEPTGFPDEGALFYAQSNTFELFTPEAHFTFGISTIDATPEIPTIDIDTGTHPSPVARLALDGGNKLYLMAADAVYFGVAGNTYGYVDTDGSSGLQLRSDNNVRLRATGVAQIVGAGVEVEPDGIGSGGLSVTISGSAVLELFAPSHDMRLTSGSSKDLILNSGNDVVIDVDTGNALLIYESGVEAARLTPDADGAVTLALGGSVTSFLIDMSTSGTMQFNADTQVIADGSGGGALTITHPGGIVIFTVAAGMSIQGGASAIGIESSSQVAIQVATNATIYNIGGTHVARYTGTGTGKRIEDINGEIYYHRRIAKLNYANDGNARELMTFVTETNTAGFALLRVWATNNTNNELGFYTELKFGWENVGGTVTLEGTVQNIYADYHGTNSAAFDLDGITFGSVTAATIAVDVLEAGGNKDVTWKGFLEVFPCPIT